MFVGRDSKYIYVNLWFIIKVPFDRYTQAQSWPSDLFIGRQLSKRGLRSSLGINLTGILS